MDTSIDPNNIWIYHERQQALLCGQHALNNLVQCGAVFSAGELADIAHQLDQLELSVFAQNNEGGIHSKDYQNRVREGSANVDAAGNFSIEVLKAALQHRFGIDLPHLSEQDLQQRGQDITEFDGFLCHKSDHWFAIRQVGGRFWNLNSTQERPTLVGHFQLATEMNKWKVQGYTIFCVPTGLPKGGEKLGQGPYWHRMADLVKGTVANKDPWENLGSGLRLDGKAPIRNLDQLSEEEMLQEALQASLQQHVQQIHETSDPALLTPEPPEGGPGVVKIQFRLPDGKRSIRRFQQTDLVGVIYSYIQQQCPGQFFELRYGFPPKDLANLREQTIGAAHLANETIQGKFS